MSLDNRLGWMMSKGAPILVALGGLAVLLASCTLAAMPTTVTLPSTPEGTPTAELMRQGDSLKVSLAGAEVIRFPLREMVSSSSEAFSPDGGLVAHSQGDGLWVAQADGSGAHRLYAVEDALQEQAYLQGWSPDGQYVLFWLGWQHSASLQADGLKLYSIPATGGERAKLGLLLVYGDFLSWSPDGTRLALTEGSGREVSCNKQIMVVSPDGRSKANLSNDPGCADIQPSWSPDGQRIAYSSREISKGILPFDEMLKGAEIWVMDAEGGNKHKLSGGPGYGDFRPLWSGDGQYILFIRVEGEEGAIWLMKATGSDQRAIKKGLVLAGNYYGHLDWDKLYY